MKAMNPPRYFVRIAGELRGPLGAEQLRSLAEAEVIAPETAVRDGANGPWVALATQAICADVFPPRRALGFKAAEFEEINKAEGPAIDPNEIAAQAQRAPASFRGREVIVAPLGRRGTLAHEDPNEVQQIVQEVGRKIAAHAPPETPPAKRRWWRRWLWVGVPAVLGTAGIMAIPLLYDRSYDDMSVSILLSWVVLYNGFLAMVVVWDAQLRDRGRVSKEKMDTLR
jgi:hypothetical protein